MKNDLYKTEDLEYFEHARCELLDLIPFNNRNAKILEIGAGTGNTLLYAKSNQFAKEVYGIELFKLENSNQSSQEFEDFIIGDIEKLQLPYEENFFDVILFADVLEHLVDPSAVIKKIKPFLKKDGVVIASIPNIRNWRIMYEILINGNFKYTNEGILDRTHLRFFTKKNIIDLFEGNNFKLLNIISNIEIVKSKSKILNKLTLGLFSEFLAVQYFVVVEK